MATGQQSRYAVYHTKGELLEANPMIFIKGHKDLLACHLGDTHRLVAYVETDSLESVFGLMNDDDDSKLVLRSDDGADLHHSTSVGDVIYDRRAGQYWQVMDTGFAMVPKGTPGQKEAVCVHCGKPRSADVGPLYMFPAPYPGVSHQRLHVGCAIGIMRELYRKELELTTIKENLAKLKADVLTALSMVEDAVTKGM